ncbi:PAS domain S-box protein [Myxococcus sp. RHSTA-1-4]|uniref:PAS domain S-box protein n=1 Tax=Myxococcus sp. RHSTA-1-4 TaxID=2874601 RepID=UPI001CBCF356|nr:PAS domain S-box protein [Myxococcus sp. RHSTA-1-4]MBZ4422949.1 PAS domain S-box protein [Myxococcus sp. RHSTA-1-4]
MADEQRGAGRDDAPGPVPEPCTGECEAHSSRALPASPPGVSVEAQRARILDDLMQDVVFQLDTHGRLTHVSKPWERLTGMLVGSWLGRPLVDVFVPEDQERARALLESAATQRSLAPREELRIEAAEGRGMRWVALSARALPAAPGEVVGTLADVTARRRAEEAVTTRERYLEVMVEVQRRMMPHERPQDLYSAVVEPLGRVSAASRVYVFEMHRGPDGNLLASQRAEWCEAGVPPNLEDPEMHGLPLLEALHPEQSGRLMRGLPVQALPRGFTEMLAPVLEGQGVKSVLLLPLHVHGQLFGVIGFDNCREARPWGPVEVNLLSGAASALSLALEQRTDNALRVRTESTLRRTEAGVHLLIEAFPDPVMVHVGDGVLLSVNPALVQYLGYRDASELAGRHVLDLVRPEDRDAARLHLGQAMEGQRSARAVEMPLMRRDGEVVVADLVTLAVVVDGAPARVTVARDFTERKRTQAQLMLTDRMASMGMLAAGIAHELNNPLAYVLSNLDYLHGTVGPRSRPLSHDELVECRQVLDDAREGAERMRQIVRQLRVFSRVDDGKEDAVDVHRVLDSVTQMAASTVRARAKLVKEYGEVPPVQGNEGKLFQVFLNLVINAAQAIEEGHSESNEIRLTSYLDDGGRVVVAVRDTGHGIPPEHLRRIFDPFFTTKASGLGTGLGLSICDTIINGMGGHISVESSVGAGTTFRVALNVAPPAPSKGAAGRPDA